MAEFNKLSIENKAISHADGLIFMIDPLQIESVIQRLPGVTVGRPDPRSLPDNMLGRLITLLKHPPSNVKAGAKIRVPLAVVVSKIDMLEPIVDAGSALLRPGAHQGASNLAEVKQSVPRLPVISAPGSRTASVTR